MKKLWNFIRWRLPYRFVWRPIFKLSGDMLGKHDPCLWECCECEACHGCDELDCFKKNGLKVYIGWRLHQLADRMT